MTRHAPSMGAGWGDRSARKAFVAYSPPLLLPARARATSAPSVVELARPAMSSTERTRLHPPRSRLGRDPRGRGAHLRAVSQRLLGEARSRERLSDRVRQRADRGRLSRRADPGGVRRRRAAAVGRPAPSWRPSTSPAATRPPATRRCTPWAPCCGTATPRRSRSTCRASPRATLRLQAFGVTEPTTGSDTTQLKTRADKKGNDRYVVNGQKVWTSAACCTPT